MLMKSLFGRSCKIHKPLTRRQLWRDSLITKVRYVVERTFDNQTRWFNTKTLRYRGACLTYATGYGV